jgi:hypothetical protein
MFLSLYIYRLSLLLVCYSLCPRRLHIQPPFHRFIVTFLLSNFPMLVVSSISSIVALNTNVESARAALKGRPPRQRLR